MRIIAAAGEFDLPMNFETQITKYNAMLTDAGEQSNPLTLRPSPVNMELVGWSNRLDAYYKPISDIDVLIADGLSVRPANLAIHTADEEDGISCTLYLGTGDFYSRVEKKKLASLNWPKIKSENYENETLEERVSFLIDYLKQEYQSSTSEIFRIAPLITSQEYSWSVDSEIITGKFYINGFERRKSFIDFTGDPNQTLDVFEAEYEQHLIVDNNDITVSRGYGMSPFLRLIYMVEFIFESFGYEFDYAKMTEDFDSDIWHYTCVLNNVADAIYAGILNFSQLVPDKTIKEFIQVIEKKYAGKFIINEVNRKVRFRRYNVTLTASIITDLSAYLTNKIKLSDSEFKKLIIRDARLTNNETDESETDTEEIVIDLLSETECVETHKAVIAAGSVDLLFYAIEIDGIKLKNSNFIVNGTKTENSDSSLDIMLADIGEAWELMDFRTDPNNSEIQVQYKRSHELMHNYSVTGKTNVALISSWYAELMQFYLHSNIPATAKLMIPAAIIESIDQHLPVMLNGQKLLIEYMKKATANDNSDVVTEVRFRTLRSYEDR